MKIPYFADTDMALLELGPGMATETRELSEDIYLDLDSSGNVVSITVEHASLQGDITEFTVTRVAKKANRAAHAER